MQYLLGIMMFLTALFLILLVLVQRGRGGGLAGAFGGAGGQSAFGTKAGDMFTKITIGTAAVWILIAALSVRILNQPRSSVLGDGSALPNLISPELPLDADPEATGSSSGADDVGLLGEALEENGLTSGNATGSETEGEPGAAPALGEETPAAESATPPETGSAAPAENPASDPAPATPAPEAPAETTPAPEPSAPTPPAAEPAPNE